jgi:hypothetical protein
MQNIRVGVCTKCKDELNIIEFMEHYFNLGFSYIFFADDNSKPSIQTIIGDKFKDKYKIVVTNFSKNTQHWRNIFTKIINENLNEIKNNVDYLFNIDLDEYLVLKNPIFQNKIQNVINYYEPFDALKINWTFFGNNNIKSANCSTLKDKFTQSANTLLDRGIKSLIKLEAYNNKVITSHIFPLKSNSIVKNVFNNIELNNSLSTLKGIKKDDTNLYLAHYITQTTERFITRRFIQHRKCKLEERIFPLYKDKYTIEEIQKIFINNSTNLIDYIHDNTPLNNELLKFSEGLLWMKKFFNGHNKNIINNFDLLEN